MTEPGRSYYDLWLKDEEAWKLSVLNNCLAGYGMAVTVYAWRWMILMQEKMSEGKTLEDIAQQTSHDADPTGDPLGGITGFQFGCAVAIISQVWEYGEQLRRWHNLKTQIGNEGELANESGTVLNPAVMIFGVEKK